ncbi:hypothetical protein FRACYDRAFT_261206 [Fragilariopsis cylindrus CCMP1102]|uniref:Uncharacterized protein n=1 Tax=Fragilariopsis cylindrus CCMP1102 TaxID=635003 RepID=A0A1E7FDU2_9STRA|nr:hypothetical protein FRACYDRAFT_261206 [Fragilariopsis cylindrus CCMP1102]|eukprot:OEU16331.1 hypothetical protein FRACYDRAFT_261206 [Fragilariopsis cylindrus CCMP1102]
MPIMTSEEENLTLVNEFTVPDQDDQKQQQQPSFSDSDSNTIPVEDGNANTTCTIMDDSNVDEDSSEKKNNNNINENDHEKDDNSSAETDDDDNDNDEDDQNSSSSSSWDILISLYLPILFVWFRRSMFGSANLIRSIVVGQLMRLVFVDDILNRISEKLHLPPWLQVILFTTTNTQSSSSATTTNDSSVLGCAVAGSSSRIEKIDPYAWPPPAFTALALLTIFALVVHPDGGTWIMLGKLRDAILTVLSTLAQSWEFLVNDYGVFPTIAAATTLATLLFLVFIVLRTLSPKNRNRSGTNHNNNHNNSNVHHNEKKRRKKKGSNNRHKRDQNHNHHNHRSNRIKKNSDLPTHQETPPLPGSSSSSSSSSSSPVSISPRPSNIHDNINSHHAYASSLPPSCPSLILDTADATCTTNSSLNEPISESGSTTPTSTNVVNHGGTTSAEGSSRMSNISIGTQCDYTVATNDTTNTTNAGKDNTSRRRMMSGSTLDTTAMSDDQSCGSASVRSYPSVSVNSNRSSGGGNVNANGSGSGNGVDTKIMNKKGTTGTGTNNSRRAAKRSTRSNAGKKNKAPTPTVETSVSSRWDALKPDHNDCNKNYISSSSPHRANGKLNNSNIKNQHQQRYQRGNNRRVGHHVGNETSSRKGRQLAVNEPPMIDRNLSNNKAASMQKSSPARRWSNEISLPIASLTPTTSTPTAAATISSPGLNPFASSSSNIKPLPPPGFQEKANVGLLHNNNEDILMTAPPKLFDTSPHVINDWRTAEDSSTAAAASMMMTSSPQRVVLSPEFFQSSSSTGTIQENPFCNNNNSNTVSTPTYRRDNSQIEAELQELGGQMAGSILDF